MNPADILLSRLENPRGSHPKWTAKCPAHEDGSPSLSVKVAEDGRVLVHCFAGCGAADVMAAVGLTLSDLFPKAPHGEFSGKPWRKREALIYRSGYDFMQSEIDRLRARLSAK